MLQVQTYLKTKTLEELKAELGIKYVVDPSGSLVILNYDQIESPKSHPIVRECRGLVLNAHNHEIVAKSFDRFFNWGEMLHEKDEFRFDNFVVDSKEDGSLCIIYFHDGKWRGNTRGSFADSALEFQDFSWSAAFLMAMNIESFDELNDILNPRVAYVCEFVSPWNKVVRSYTAPKMYLLTACDGHRELSYLEVDHLFDSLEKTGKNPFIKPVRYSFTNIDEIIKFLDELQENDPTNEGVVIRDLDNRRWKLKNATYLSLHRMRGEGDNLYNPKNIIPFVLSGEGDELLTYFPEVSDRFFEIKQKIEEEFENLKSIWSMNKDIESQKDFALSIVGKTKFTGILFQLRKQLGKDQTESDLKTCWRSSGDMILKMMF